MIMIFTRCRRKKLKEIDELDSRGIHAERICVYTDIKALIEYGADIIGEKKGRNYEYHVNNALNRKSGSEGLR